MEIIFGINDYVHSKLLDESGKIGDRFLRSDRKEYLIPSCMIDSRVDPEWKVIFKEGDFKVAYSEKDKEIRYQNTDFIEAEWDILFFLRQTFDKQLNERGFITLHASALSDERGAIIITGESGSGKTSLSLQGSQEKYHFVANDSAVISPDLKVVAGTQLIVFKEKMAKRFFPKFKQVGNSPAPGVRSACPSEIYGENIETEPKQVRLILNPKISGTSFEYPLSKNITKHDLYVSSSEYVSGLFLLKGLQKPCEIDLDSPDLRRKRYDLVNRLVDNVDCIRIEGLPKKILTRLKKL